MTVKTLIICDDCAKPIGMMFPDLKEDCKLDTSYTCWDCYTRKYLNTKLKRKKD